MITIKLEPLEDFFPQERPLEAEIRNIDDVFFSLEKKQILDFQNQTNLNKFVEKSEQKHQNLIKHRIF